jgi:DNA-binding transcriptional regulator of glucitol operon
VRSLFSRRWIGIHCAVLLVIPGFLALGWWQYTRAGEGNARSIGYAFEWPTFALIVIVMWIKAMRDVRRGVVPPEPPSPSVAEVAAAEVRRATTAEVIAADEAEDPELAAYNQRLAALHARDLRRQP